jgi:2-polyprenyl-3-methyl-5-hydroxy-6-metoxy-1,4-benzoquinol methylase
MTASFRDPSGRVISSNGKIFRTINSGGVEEFNTAFSSNQLQSFVRSGSLVGARILDEAEKNEFAAATARGFDIAAEEISLAVEHEKIPFPSYPYEWTPEMLYAAGQLTLDFAERLLPERIGLKDATPYNILFKGAKPVFVDWLSFEKRDPLDPIWIPQAQFVRTFILPLLVNKHFGMSLGEVFITNRDGLEPEDVYEMAGGLRKFRSPFLSMVTLPKMLGAKKSKDTSIYEKRRSDDPEKARFILEHQFKQLRKLLKKVAPNDNRTSEWAEYVGPKQHFTDEYLKQKDDFVNQTLAGLKPRTVLDVGCNTGYFSRIAARNGASVVSLDQDAVSVGNVWRTASEEGLDILPLVVDITRPSPGIGWRNSECPSFLERITGKFDAVLMLAVIHHMLVTERVPLPEIIKLFSEITTDTLIIEFVAPEDPMFKIIARGRDHLFKDLTNDSFRRECSKHFKIIREERLAQTNRWLYLLRR